MQELRLPNCRMLFGLLLSLLAWGSLIASPAVAQTPLRINCGGSQVSFPDTGVWQADTDFVGGSSWGWAPDELRVHHYPYVQNTTDPEIYLSCRASTDTFSYNLPAVPGNYTLNLHFMEGDRGAQYPGFRLFNVSVNGTQVLTNFDVETTAGAIGNALVESFPVTVSAGGSGVTVSFQTVKYSAMVSAIELIPAGPATPTAPAAPSGLTATAGNGQVSLAWNSVPGASSYSVYRGTSPGGEGATPVASGLGSPAYTDTGLSNGTTYYYVVTATNGVGEGQNSSEASATPGVIVPGTTTLRINSGGGAYTDAASNVWQADTDYNGGATWSFYGLNITGTPDPELYRDVRYSAGTFGYTLPAAPGAYTLKLHFVEGDGHCLTPGFRTFNVLVNGATALSNLDVAAQAGGLGKALDESIPVTVAAGGSGVTVTFQTVSYGAMVSALELVPASNG